MEGKIIVLGGKDNLIAKSGKEISKAINCETGTRSVFN